jgi:hypothetical protein
MTLLIYYRPPDLYSLVASVTDNSPGPSALEFLNRGLASLFVVSCYN